MSAAASGVTESMSAAANSIGVAMGIVSGTVEVAVDQAESAVDGLAATMQGDIPAAVDAASEAMHRFVASIPDRVRIPVDVNIPDYKPPLGGKGSPDIPEYAGGTQGWREFGGGTLAVLHGREAVVRPGDPALPGQQGAGGGDSVVVNLAISENPMQTAETVREMRKFTLDTVERETAKRLSELIAAGKA
jgi:hypothetical protein